MDRNVQNSTAQAERLRLERFIRIDNDALERIDPYFSIRYPSHDTLLKINMNPPESYLRLLGKIEKSLKENVIAPQDSKREKLFQQYFNEEAAKTMEAIEIKMQAEKESEKKMASKNKADSDDNDNNESKKDDFKKNNLDSEVSDDDKERVATANNKRGNNGTVESDKEKNNEEDYTRGKESSQFEFDINFESALSDATRRRRAKALENFDEEEYFSLKCLKIIL